MSTEQEPLIINLSNPPPSMDCFSNPVKPSAVRTKRNGDKESPCLKPRNTSNSLLGLPLTRIDILLLKINNSIHFNHLLPNLILSIMYFRYSSIVNNFIGH